MTVEMDLPNVLGLDEESLRWRRLLGTVAHHLETATLVGNPAPIVKHMRARMKEPQVGDYVVELSTFYRGRGENGPTEWAHGTGYLQRVVEEPAGSDEDWAEEMRLYPESVRPTDDFWYVKYGPAEEDVTRWYNCTFLAIPLTADFFELPEAGIRNEDGSVTFTRDSLIGHLAGAGFTMKDAT